MQDASVAIESVVEDKSLEEATRIAKAQNVDYLTEKPRASEINNQAICQAWDPVWVICSHAEEVYQEVTYELHVRNGQPDRWLNRFGHVSLVWDHMIVL